MPHIILKWEELINTTLNPCRACSNLITEKAIESLIAQSQYERENVRNILIDELIDREKTLDKQQYVQVVQTMLIRLIDKLHYYKQVEGLNEHLLRVYHNIDQHLQTVLNFIEDFFSNYFDRNAKVPATYLLVSIAELCEQLEEFKEILKLNNSVDKELTNILVNHFNTFCSLSSTGPTYNELLYHENLMKVLLSADVLSSIESIKEVLFHFNFNHHEFVSYLFNNLKFLSECSGTNTEKIAALRYEQKNINQFRTKLNCCYSPNMPSLKDLVNSWIEEEIKYLKIDPIYSSTVKGDNEGNNKIQTSLSVQKLALLIRLMVVDKIITNRVVAQVLRIVIKTVATTQSDNIGFGSIESKYHKPDKGTITAVKDLLFRWINILNQL